MTMTSGRSARAAVSGGRLGRPDPGSPEADLAGLAAVGLRTRKLRAGLSALGIAIGVAAIVAVLGLAASSQAALLNEIQALGTNLLTANNGQTLTGATAELPTAAPGMIARLTGVTGVQDTSTVGGVDVYKNPDIPAVQTNAIGVDAATLGLPAMVGTSLAQGDYLNAATTRGQIRIQFLAEAILLSLAGGAIGVAAGAAATAIYARGHHELTVIPSEAWAGGLAAAVVIGALAGLLPAIRAARLSPTQALWSI